MMAKFTLGTQVVTRGVADWMAASPEAGVFTAQCLARHASGDWGDMDKHDAAMNDEAVRDGGSRIHSAYKNGPGGTALWIITEIGDYGENGAPVWVTTILFPDEY